MVARTLESRLTVRFLVVGGAVSALVCATAVLLADRVMDESETTNARAIAGEARDLLESELNEGDRLDEALDEVVPAGRTADGAASVRITAYVRGAPPRGTGGVLLPEVTAGTCATVNDARGAPWRACGAGTASGTVVAAVPLTGHRQAIGALARAMVGVNLAALVVLWLIVRRALRRPLAELAALVGWAGRIVESTEPLPPPPAASREIADLAGAFDALVRRLMDVLARERASSAHIAHELRTPLTTITAGLHDLHLRDDASKEAVQKLRAEVARFADVIEAILVLSSSDRAARSDVVVNVADLARELAPAGVPVHAPDEALALADEALVALALRNLIGNAERHGRGPIGIHVLRDGDLLRLEVVDAGPGVSETERARMFERYWRGSADAEGRGLGLALVKAVAERHDGTAGVEGGPSGKGLRVFLTLGRVVGWHEPESPTR
jgi:two-component system OmpR family sensor kinase